MNKYRLILESSLQVAMDEIEPGLYVGNKWARKEVGARNIRTVISLTTTKERADFEPLPVDVKEHTFGVQDVPTAEAALVMRDNVVKQAAQLIAEARAIGHHVLVHCYAGMSRSPGVVIYYLMMRDSISHVAAFRRVNSKRPGVLPNGKFISLLKELSPVTIEQQQDEEEMV